MEEPTLYLTCGLPGSGKTTLARRLAAEHDAFRFTKDELVSRSAATSTTRSCATASKQR